MALIDKAVSEENMLKFYTCTLSQSGVRFFSKPLLFSNVVHFLRCLPINDILKFFTILMYNYVTYVGFAKIGHGNHSHDSYSTLVINAPCHVSLKPVQYIKRRWSLKSFTMHEHGGYLGDVIWIIYSLKPPRRGGSNVYPQSMS